MRKKKIKDDLRISLQAGCGVTHLQSQSLVSSDNGIKKSRPSELLRPCLEKRKKKSSTGQYGNWTLRLDPASVSPRSGLAMHT